MTENFQRLWMHALGWIAPSGKGLKTALSQIIELRLRQDASRGVPGAQKENVKNLALHTLIPVHVSMGVVYAQANASSNRHIHPLASPFCN